MSAQTATPSRNGSDAPAAPFDVIPVDDLPTANVGKTRTAEDEALAVQYIEAMSKIINNKPQAARESTVHPDRATANKRAAAVKRLVNGSKSLPEGKRAAARIIAVPAGGFQVAVLFVDAPAATEATTEPTAATA